MVKNLFGALILLFGINGLTFSQCYIQSENPRDCPTGTDVNCASGTCEYFSQNPQTGEWFLVTSPMPGWVTVIKCGDTRNNQAVPKEIQHSDATDIPTVLGLVAPGEGHKNYDLGEPVWCIKEGSCSCEGVGQGNPCLLPSLNVVVDIVPEVINLFSEECVVGEVIDP